MTLLSALLASSATAATVTVDASGGSDHTDLADAIEAASSGDTITVASGTYTGPFNTMGKNLSIVGSGVSATLLTAGSTQSVVTVENGETVTLKDLTLYDALQGLEVRASQASGGQSRPAA